MTPQELKNSILQLAIQGKLVEQRPEEGTAVDLYKQIQAEKQALIKAGKIKKEKSLPEITEDEIPFEIPESWMWVRLGDYAQKITDQVASGSFASLRENVPSLKEPDYAIMVKSADFSNGFTRNLTYTTRHGYEFLENSNLFGGELILSNIGSIGKCFIVPYLDQRMTLAPNAVMVRLISDDHRDYLYNFILSPLGYAELMSITSGTAMKKFNKTDLKTILVPIPPLAEQKRIVAKIEELLPLIDRYEEAWTRLEAFNKRFPSDMQKSLLQLAIQGKLVDQRPEEGTGEDLYQKIQAEKQSLIRSGKIKKEKPFSTNILYQEHPFDIPDSWRFVRFGELMISRDSERIPVSTAERSQRNKVYDYYGASGVIDKIDDYLFDKELLLIGEDGANLLARSTAIAFLAKGKYWVNNHAHVLDGCAGLNLSYICYYINAISLAPYVTGTAQPKMNQENMNAIWVALPPLAEQERIVAKLESILPLCDRLRS